MKSSRKQLLWPFAAALCLLVALIFWAPHRELQTPPASKAQPEARPQTSKVVKFAKPKPAPLPEIDVRSREGSSEQPPADRVASFEELKRERPMILVRFDEISGSPSYLQETGKFLTDKHAEMSARDVVKDYVNRYPVLFGHDGAALDSARVTREDVTAHNGMTTLVWQQQHAGIPLYNTIFKANVTRDGEVITLSDHFLPDAAAAAGNQDAVPGISVQEAVAKTAAGLGDVVAAGEVNPATSPQGAEQKQRFTAPKLSDTTAHLAWVPMSAKSMRLAWDVTTVSLDRGEMYQTLVDAESGELLHRRSLTSDISDASYRVYTAESPSPFSPGHETPSSLQPAYVNRVLHTTQALNTTASPNGWINDGSTETNGNNVDAHTDTDANNSPDLPRPTSATRVFDFPMDLTKEPGTYKDASVTQLFYWCNYMHDRMYDYGFTESAGNFQVNNFGRGGLGNDAVLADAQDGSGTNDANFLTPQDGSPGRMQMYLWSGPTPDRDCSLDAEIVFHEYGHGVSNRLVGGGVGIHALASMGLGEGWSDFYALALTAEASDNPHGNWAMAGYSYYLGMRGFSENYSYGIRRYGYSTDMLKNPFTLKDIDPTQVDWHTNVPRNPTFSATNDVTWEHYQGTVWCAMLWDMRASLILKHGFATGNDRAIRLVTDGMKLSPVDPNFIQARDGILQATLVSYPGDLGEVWTAFAKRGAGQWASAPGSRTTTSIVESYTVPDSLQISDRSGWNITGNKGGPFTPGTKVLTLYNIGAAPVTWTVNTNAAWLLASPASGTLAAGAKVNVTVTTQAEAMIPGFHGTNLVFTNTGTNFNQPVGVRLYVAPPVVQAFSLNTDPGWTRTGEWAFGIPSGGGGGTGNADPTGGATGVNVFGVNLGGNHSSTVSGPFYLTSGAVNLSLYTKTRLRFKRWLNTDSQFRTRVTVEVTTDGSNWREVYVNPGSTVQGNEVEDNTWQTMEYDISSIADQQGAVQVRWSYRVLVTNAYSGWNIDDVEFLGETTNNLTITSADSVVESDSPLTATLTISRAQTSPLVVTLASSDPTAATVPASVTLNAGETSTSFQITPLDDALADGSQTTLITASAAGTGQGIKRFAVMDNETATLTLALPASVTEGGEAGLGTVTRSTVNNRAVTVSLSSSDPTAATVLDTVVIPANVASVSFAVNAVNDSWIDGKQSTTIAASVAGWTGASGAVNVLDNEALKLTVIAPDSLTEGGTGKGSVSIPGTLLSDLTVNLSSNNAKLTVPATVIIAAGETLASFSVSAPDDTRSESNATATIMAVASGFTPGGGATSVIDNELHHFTWKPIASSQTLNYPFSVTVTANNLSNSTITSYTGTANLSGTGTSGAIAMVPAVTKAFMAGVWTGSIVISAATTNAVLSASDGAGHAGMSNGFSVGVGGLHHFAFGNISSPQKSGAAFRTTITAQDLGNNTVTSYGGAVMLKALLPASTVVGTGTLTQFEYPLYTPYEDERTQCLYLQSEIGGAKTLGALTLDVTRVPAQALNNWTIRIKHTNLNSYVIASSSWESTGWTTVYQANETIATTGLKTFIFSTPFAYDGVSNLMVDFSFNNNSSSPSAGIVRCSRVDRNAVIYAYSDSEHGDPLSWTNNGPALDFLSWLPNITLQEATGLTVSPAETGNFTAGEWTGDLVIDQAVELTAKELLSGFVLTASDGAGHMGVSNSFRAGEGSLHHFTFDNIGASQKTGEPIRATITARDVVNNTVTRFGGKARLNAPLTKMIGEGDLIEDVFPLGAAYFEEERTQCIYLKREIGGAASLRGLSLNVTTAPGQTLNNWTIRLKHTKLDSYNADASWEGTGWTTVYQANETITAAGMKIFNFSTPFEYDGVSNLMVDFSFNNSSSDYDLKSGAVMSSRIEPYRVIYKGSDGDFWGDPLAWTSSVPSWKLWMLPNITLLTGAGVTISPAETSNFTAGVWMGDLAIDQAADQVVVEALSGNVRGYSNDFTVKTGSGGNLALSLPVSVTEGGVGDMATVTRSVVDGNAVTVTLSNSNPAEVVVPATVIIPAGQASVTFVISPVDDVKIDGTQATTIAAAATGWAGASAVVNVLDNENWNLSVSLPSVVAEGVSGMGAVSISGTLTTALVVRLSSNQAALTVPETVTIPVGATSASFTLQASEDTLAAANLTAAITASASGFGNGIGSVVVEDNDVSYFSFASIASPQRPAVPLDITVTARNMSGGVARSYSGTVMLSGSGSSGVISMSATTSVFTAGVWTGQVTVNTAASNVVLTANDGTGHVGTSDSFAVVNSFVGTTGQGNVFYGVLRPYGSAATSNGTVGWFTGTMIPKTGGFSGKLLVDGVTRPVLGTFSPMGDFNLSSRTLNMAGRSVAMSYGAGGITVELSEGGSTVVSGLAKRNFYSTTNKVPPVMLNRKLGGTGSSNNQGFFTMTMPAKIQTPAKDVTTYPQGDGIASVTLRDAGTVMITGALADGSTFLAGTALVSSGECPMYSQTAKGCSLSGDLTVDVTKANSDITSTDLLWIRAGVKQVSGVKKTQLYTDGWPTGIRVDALGAFYDKTVDVRTALGLGAVNTTTGNGLLKFTGGKLMADLSVKAFNIAPGTTTGVSTVTKIPLTNSTFVLVATQSVGQFSGSFTPNWTSPAAAKPLFKGVLIQKGASKGGYGYFISNRTSDLDPESGRVTLGAQAP